MDDPAADYAICPWKLADVAAQELKVVLSGEGGDELFAGYGRYRRLLRPWWRGGRTIERRGTFDRLKVLKNPRHTWRDSIAAMEASGSMSRRSKLQIAQATDFRDWLPNVSHKTRPLPNVPWFRGRTHHFSIRELQLKCFCSKIHSKFREVKVNGSYDSG